MKTLLLLFTLFIAVAHADGDFGEGGGPKVTKGFFINNFEMAYYADRAEYASVLDNLAFKTVDYRYELLDGEKLLRLNLLKTQYSKDPKKIAETIKEGETFFIDKRKIKAKEFEVLELRSVIRFYTYSNQKINSDDICEFFVKVKKQGEVHTLGDLLHLRVCSTTQKIRLDEIYKVKIEFRKKY